MTERLGERFSRGSSRAAGECQVAAPTVGVEEEFLIVDPQRFVPVALGPQVAGTTGDDELKIQLELSPAQVEAATGVCPISRTSGLPLLTRLRRA